MPLRNENSVFALVAVASVIVVALVAVPAFSVGWKTGCFASAAALFGVVGLWLKALR